MRPWYAGNDLIMWIARTILLKMDYLGLIELKIGQYYKFGDIMASQYAADFGKGKKNDK